MTADRDVAKRRSPWVVVGAAALLACAVGGVLLYVDRSDDDAAIEARDPAGPAGELGDRNHALERALTATEADRASAQAARDVALARAEAARAAAQAATDSAAAAQRDQAETEHALEAARARTRALEELLKKQQQADKAPR